MKIHATVMLYNDRTFLVAMLESIKDYVDSIIICDGAYKLYFETMLKHDPKLKPWSTDGSLKLIKLIDDKPETKIIKPPNGEPWLNQLVKRKAMLDAVPKGDWFLGIDCDEVLMGNPREAFEEVEQSGCVVGQFPIYHAGTDLDRLYMYWHPRLFQKVGGMHYFGTHWQLRDAYKRIIESSYPVKFTDKCVIAHLKLFKPASKVLKHEEYIEQIKNQGWIDPYQTR